MVTNKEVMECKRMTSKWKKEERGKEKWHIAPACSPLWIQKEAGEPWHKSLHGKKMNWNKWMKEELHEEGVETWHSEHKSRRKM